MNVVVQKLDVRARARNTDAQWGEPVFRSAEVPDFEALDPDVALVVDNEHAAPAVGSEMLAF